MNKKSLSRDELQELFDRFDSLPNKNDIILLGKYERRRDEATGGISQTRYNPNYRFINTYDEENRLIGTVPTAKIVIKQPSPSRIDRRGKMFETTLPLFTTDGGVDIVKEVCCTSSNEQYILCRGKVQNFFVVRREEPSPELIDFLRKWTVRETGEENSDMVDHILGILRMSPDCDSNMKIPMLNVWIHELHDATDIAEELIQKGHLAQINNVILQGLVYMPPSLKTDGGRNRLHFKLRVKREDIEGQTVPDSQKAPNGYDIINVIYDGEKAEQYFMELQQGYPVQVKGRLENYHFIQKAFVNQYEQMQLAKWLNTGIGDPRIQDIVSFVASEKRQVSVPTYNILLEELNFDPSTWE